MLLPFHGGQIKIIRIPLHIIKLLIICLERSDSTACPSSASKQVADDNATKLSQATLETHLNCLYGDGCFYLCRMYIIVEKSLFPFQLFQRSLSFVIVLRRCIALFANVLEPVKISYKIARRGPARALVVCASASVLLGLESTLGRVLAKPCKLVCNLLITRRTHGVRKSFGAIPKAKNEPNGTSAYKRAVVTLQDRCS